MSLRPSAAKMAVALPKAKTTDIVVQELENEMLVYDLENDKAHHLNETVSFVWKQCDGKTPVREIAAALSDKLKTNIEDDFVSLAIYELQKANLLSSASADLEIDLTRRNILFKYAPMAVALPVVMSLVAPPSAHAQSCFAPGVPCPSGGTCCDFVVACEGPACPTLP